MPLGKPLVPLMTHPRFEASRAALTKRSRLVARPGPSDPFSAPLCSLRLRVEQLQLRLQWLRLRLRLKLQLSL